MKRYNFFLTDQQAAALRNKSLETGLSVSEIIRRVIDKFIKGVRVAKTLKR